jgi:hypothetical protein
MLVRLLTVAGLACGVLFSAEQQLPSGESSSTVPLGIKTKPDALPVPLSSAIEHMVTGKWPESKSMDIFSQAPQLLLAEQAAVPTQRCSIPLKEYKIPDNVQFFIERMPAPDNSAQTGRMPVMHAPVCGEPSSPDAH